MEAAPRVGLVAEAITGEDSRARAIYNPSLPAAEEIVLNRKGRPNIDLSQITAMDLKSKVQNLRV